jgi:glycosyltransferase involved in cell wall biosynthesis
MEDNGVSGCRVSVCITTYNGEKFIEMQLDSIMEQLGRKDEVIISDDGSQDQTLEVLRNKDYPRLRLHCNSKRKGVIRNVENIFEKAMLFSEKIPMHDWWIGLIGKVFGKSFFCPENLVLPLTITWMRDKLYNDLPAGKEVIT